MSYCHLKDSKEHSNTCEEIKDGKNTDTKEQALLKKACGSFGMPKERLERNRIEVVRRECTDPEKLDGLVRATDENQQRQI
jgi:hypothetical protein